MLMNQNTATTTCRACWSLPELIDSISNQSIAPQATLINGSRVARNHDLFQCQRQLVRSTKHSTQVIHDLRIHTMLVNIRFLKHLVSWCLLYPCAAKHSPEERHTLAVMLPIRSAINVG